MSLSKIVLTMTEYGDRQKYTTAHKSMMLWTTGVSLKCPQILTVFFFYFFPHVAVCSVWNGWAPKLLEQHAASPALRRDRALRGVCSVACGIHVLTCHQCPQQGRSLCLVMLLDERHLGHREGAAPAARAKGSGRPLTTNLRSVAVFSKIASTKTKMCCPVLSETTLYITFFIVRFWGAGMYEEHSLMA